MWGKVGVTLVSVLLLVVAVFLAAAPALAEPPAAYLAEMPSSQQVLTKIKGKDRLDTLARQYAAFERLGAIMGVLEGSREFDPAPSEVRVTSEYHEQAGQIQTQATSSVSSADKPKWFALAWGYESDKKFNRQLMTTFFSPSFRARYDTSVQTAASQRSAAKAATTAAAEAAAKAADDTSGQVNPLWVWLGGGAAFVPWSASSPFPALQPFDLGGGGRATGGDVVTWRSFASSRSSRTHPARSRVRPLLRVDQKGSSARRRSTRARSATSPTGSSGS